MVSARRIPDSGGGGASWSSPTSRAARSTHCWTICSLGGDAGAAASRSDRERQFPLAHPGRCPGPAPPGGRQRASVLAAPVPRPEPGSVGATQWRRRTGSDRPPHDRGFRYRADFGASALPVADDESGELIMRRLADLAPGLVRQGWSVSRGGNGANRRTRRGPATPVSSRRHGESLTGTNRRA